MKPHHSASSAAKAKPSTEGSPAARKPRAATKPVPALPDLGRREDMVREAAYYYYEARGCVDGHELEDWLRAESDIERVFGSVDSTESARH